MIIVSHDRFLVEACADRLWLVGGGRVRPFDGDMEDYRKFVLSGGLDENGGRETRRDERPVRTDDRKSAAQKRSQQAPLRKQLAQVEARIEKAHRGDRQDRRGDRRRRSLPA